MEITEVKIIEMGVNIKIKVSINNLIFYSQLSFENEEQARKILACCGLHEMKI